VFSVLTIEQQNVEMVERYLSWFRDTRGRQPSSTYDYASRLAQYLRFIGRTPVGSAAVDQMEAFVNRPRRGRQGLGAASTRAKEVSILRSFYAYLAARGLIESDPSRLLHAPEVRNVNPKPVPKALWSEWWSSDLDPEWRVVTGLGFFVGLRREEIVNLSPSHVSPLSQKLVGFIRKGGGDDVTPYGDMVGVFADHHPEVFGSLGPDSFLGPLHDLAKARSGRPRLLDWRERNVVASRTNTAKHALAAHDIDPESVNSRFDYWQRKVGLHGRFTPHMLRHSAATYLVGAGVPLHIVQVLMNHSSINTTMRYVKVGGSPLADWRRTQPPSSVGKLRLDLANYNRHG